MVRKEKKKECQNRNCKWGHQTQKSSILAMGLNVLKLEESNKKMKKCDQDISNITCYNRDQKGHYISKFFNPLKN